MERKNSINNSFYETLGEAWYEDNAHPVALLRQENSARNPWIIKTIEGSRKKILDLGCGAGFLTNALAQQGHQVTGVDISITSLKIAKQKDTTQTVHYLALDALDLPFEKETFDVICAMDFLEHIPKPEKIIQNATHLLKKDGLFFFHTFNRNLLSYFLIIKGVEWLVPNTPNNLHLYSYFIKPSEIRKWCEHSNLKVEEMHGFRPCFSSTAFWKSLLTRRVAEDFTFKFTKNLSTGYLGYAKKLT